MWFNNIDPQLLQIMDLIAGPRETPATNEPAENAFRNDMLEFLFGQGWAEMRVREGKRIWVATASLPEALRGEQIEPSSHMRNNAGEPAGEPAGQSTCEQKLTGSLEIMMAAFMDHARNERLARGEEPEEVTADRMLRMLARLGKVRLRPDPEGELVWVPSPEAFEDFNDIIFGHRTIGIRTDDVLKHMAQNLYELGEAHTIGADVCDDVASLAMLQGLEVAGDAIAYRDSDGALAWRGVRAAAAQRSQQKTASRVDAIYLRQIILYIDPRQRFKSRSSYLDNRF